MSSYYHIDFEAVELERQLSGGDALTAPIVESLNDLVCTRRDAALALPDWMMSMRAATERTLRRLERHVRASLAVHTPLRTVEHPGELGYGLECEHELLRTTLFDQLAAAAPTGDGPLAGRAAHLLDVVIDSECLLAVHLNGIGRALRQLGGNVPSFRTHADLAPATTPALIGERAS